MILTWTELAVEIVVPDDLPPAHRYLLVDTRGRGPDRRHIIGVGRHDQQLWRAAVTADGHIAWLWIDGEAQQRHVRIPWRSAAAWADLVDPGDAAARRRWQKILSGQQEARISDVARLCEAEPGLVETEVVEDLAAARILWMEERR
jgi:hypothetical protein